MCILATYYVANTQQLSLKNCITFEIKEFCRGELINDEKIH